MFQSCFNIILDCNQSDIVGDGYCNDESNTFECNYDGGDCCGPCINTNLCTECLCFSNIPKYDIDCGNYFTDSCAKCTNFLCSEDCTRVNSECVPSFLSNPLVGNGVCNNETNIKECNFDGGDCCKPLPNKELCSKCECCKLKHHTNLSYVA